MPRAAWLAGGQGTMVEAENAYLKSLELDPDLYEANSSTAGFCRATGASIGPPNCSSARPKSGQLTKSPSASSKASTSYWERGCRGARRSPIRRSGGTRTRVATGKCDRGDACRNGARRHWRCSGRQEIPDLGTVGGGRRSVRCSSMPHACIRRLGELEPALDLLEKVHPRMPLPIRHGRPSIPISRRCRLAALRGPRWTSGRGDDACPCSG